MHNNQNDITGTGTLTVDRRAVVLSGARPYDGTTDADFSILSVDNFVGSDQVFMVSGSGTLAGSAVGTQAITNFGTLALGGAAAGNYTLTGASGAVTISPPVGTVTGKITNAYTSYPVDGAEVTVYAFDGEYEGTSGPDGVFTISGVPTGEHTYTADGTNQGYTRLSGSVTVGMGTNTLNLAFDAVSVKMAAALGWIDGHAYRFIPGNDDYEVIEPDDMNGRISPWEGFWVGVFNHDGVNIMFQKEVILTKPSSDAEPYSTTNLDTDEWYLLSAPGEAIAGHRDLNSVFTGLGMNEVDWRAVKWDYAQNAYVIYDPLHPFPEVIPGRGFWIKQITGDSRTVRFYGSETPLTDGFYTLSLPWKQPSVGMGDAAAHMVGNPFKSPMLWSDVRIKLPAGGAPAPVGKAAATSGSIEKWYVGIKLEATDSSSRDRYNRAGVVSAPGANIRLFNAMDLVPPDSYVNVNLKDPADQTRGGLAYDFRAAGRDEYSWEINLSTSFPSVAAVLRLDNLANVPSNVHLTLKDLNTGEETVISGDFSLPLTLSAGASRKYLLTARLGLGPGTLVEEARPAAFGFTGAAPNPFNPSTTINFGIERQGTAKVCVYGINGQLVATLANGTMESGKHRVIWNARDCSSGVYLVVLEAGGKRDSMKISLIK